MEQFEQLKVVSRLRAQAQPYLGYKFLAKMMEI